ncbi:hypothetical protein C0J52_08616 [Blattella germanica]|nr:hypothetical protein C0J52_08616 [Blattella germanica]
MPTSGSRTEFLAVDALGSATDIQYGRKGGCFISTKKALFIGSSFLVALILVGVLVHYFGTQEPKKVNASTGTGSDASAATGHPGSGGTTEAPIPADQLRLPKDVMPTLYRLRLDPYLDKPDPEGKTFHYKGSVSIVIHCINSTNKISLHSKGLTIGENVTISIYNESEPQGVTSAPATPAPPVMTPNEMASIVQKETNSNEKPTVMETKNSTPNATQTSTQNVTPTATTTNTNSSSPNVTQTEAQNGTSPSPQRRKRNASFSRHNHQHRSADHHETHTTTLAPGTPPQISGHKEDNKTNILTFNVNPPLQAGQHYQLDITFTGLLRNDSLFGFYASEYKDAKNETKWMATTQFEAPHAREAFPCFDEPAMKAKFEINIARDSNMVTISNMPLKNTEELKDKPGRVLDHYEVSPIMSTYLLAFIVAPSDFIPTNNTMETYLQEKGGNKTGPEFRVYARGQLIESASYAASIGPKVLEYYGEYFNISYPLPKLHMAAIPDFAAGAMENWGLLTYRETALLYDEKSSSMYNKENVAIVVAHEIAHQWFGNLVEPTWAMMDKFVVLEQQSVMMLDSLNSTHPVSSPVTNPAQIAEIFDYISYNKGASKYNNAEEQDLWDALTEETKSSADSLLPEKTSVKEIMDTWTLQDGYPLVTVIRDYEKGSAKLTQQRFSLENKTSESLWYIPISYATQEEMGDSTNASRRTFPRAWMKNEKSTTIENLSKPQSNSWVLFNIHSTGYYRVNYDEKNWGLLTAHLLNSDPKDALTPVTRAQLLDDVMNLARADLTGYDVALNLSKYLAAKEKDYVPWKAALRNLYFLETMLRDTTAFGLFMDYMLKTFTPMKSFVGFEAARDESQLQTLLRPVILQGLGTARDPEVEKWAIQIPVDMRSTVYCVAVKAGGRKEWSFVLERFKNAGAKPSERGVLLESLGCAKEEWLLVTLLDKSLGQGGEIRRQDAYKAWRVMPSTSVGSRVAFNYVRKNWDTIYEEYGKDEYLMGDILRGAIAGLTTELDLHDVKEFRDRNVGKFNFAERTFKQLIEALERRVDWNKKHYSTIVNWLEKNK